MLRELFYRIGGRPFHDVDIHVNLYCFTRQPFLAW